MMKIQKVVDDNAKRGTQTTNLENNGDNIKQWTIRSKN